MGWYPVCSADIIFSDVYCIAVMPSFDWIGFYDTFTCYSKSSLNETINKKWLFCGFAKLSFICLYVPPQLLAAYSLNCSIRLFLDGMNFVRFIVYMHLFKNMLSTILWTAGLYGLLGPVEVTAALSKQFLARFVKNWEADKVLLIH